jgi:hypothetical protein
VPNSQIPASTDPISNFGFKYKTLLLILTAVLTIASTVASGMIAFDDDPTDFMPTDNKTVANWLDMTKRFGALDLLMIGLEEPDKPLSFDGLVAAARVTDALAECRAQGVHYVRSVTNVTTLLPGGGETINAELLIPSIPRSPEERDALLLRILADTQAPGSLISRDLMGYSILVRVDQRNDMAEMAKLVMDVVNENKGPLNANFFGAPFISHQITDSVFGKLVWVVPLFVLALFGIIWLRIRNLAIIGVLLLLIGLPVLWWLGLLVVTGTVLSTTGMNAALLILAVSLVVFSRGAERWLARSEAPFTVRTMLLLIASALALGALTKSPLSFLVQFGSAGSIGLLSVALVGVVAAPALLALFKPGIMPQVEKGEALPFSRKSVTRIALTIFIVSLLVALQLRFIVYPPDIFSKSDSVGSSLAFFDRHFGGNDFIQISAKGNLRKPAVLAKIMAITDLLEGQKDFADVRSITQVAGFLASNFAGSHRIPVDRPALDNLYFFLEGNEDVRSLVTDERDEAMIAIRVPANPSFTAEQWAELVLQTIAQSKADPPTLAQRRLRALADRFKVTVTDSQIATAIKRAQDVSQDERGAIQEKALVMLNTYMQSDESPFETTDDEWIAFRTILKEEGTERKAHLVAAIIQAPSFLEAELPEDMGTELADMLVTRFDDFVVRARAASSVQSLMDGAQFSAVPKAFVTRAEGIVADLMDRRTFSDDISFSISGLPVILPTLESSLKSTLLWAILVLWALMSGFAFVIVRKFRQVRRAAIEAALASVLVLALGWLFGIQIDSASATLYLLPPVLAFLMSPWLVSESSEKGEPALFAATFAAALALASLSLILTDVLPVMRLGAVLANSLAVVVAISIISRRLPLADN